MRKLFFAALTAIVFTTSAFAEGNLSINRNIQNSFHNDFGEVEGVQWSTTANFATATFIMNNKRTNAFYDRDGNWIGTTWAVTVDEMPAAAKRTFAKKYGGYTVTESIRFEGATETAYFISAKKDEKSVILKVMNGSVSVYM
jgi:hypothetical protein